MEKQSSLYFLALIPPKHISDKIHAIKLYVAEKHNCKHALKSPPHITLEPPFHYPLHKENFLLQKISELNKSLSDTDIPVELNGYDVFLPKVVFINVIQNSLLTNVYNHVHSFVKTELKVVKDLPPRPFHPHITIAFRDVKKHLVTQILEDVKQNFPIKETFCTHTIALLKYGEHQWNAIL